MLSGLRGDFDTCGGCTPIGSHLPERIDPDQAEQQQRYVDARKSAQACRHVLEGGTAARFQSSGNGIVAVVRAEDTIENQPYVPNPELVELAARALGLRERWRIWTRHMSNPSYTASSNALSRFKADKTMQ